MVAEKGKGVELGDNATNSGSRKETATMEYFSALGKPKRCAAEVDNQRPGNHRTRVGIIKARRAHGASNAGYGIGRSWF